ncbi:radical SAM domain protein [Treponema primitia ZAS-2]|uniref:Radical SAM domain protein n=1 Tax=Treponema primitia (strain ATCC BAA-887 / DSM 12427 / ZAS-2) TaxID=545694 RepID=F5YIP4_TREPZ|nr:radical SAM protein [Treponema primitia]AEF85592.1 radical SAM domain protein [Treponema primitia ZAS-2]
MHFKEVKGILSSKNGMNISRGCIHGCIYCDARSKCYNMDHVFEDVEIKINAPELLEQKLKTKRKKCMIGTGAMSDPYIPIPENLNNIRTCLEIIEKYRCGLAIQTKSSLILRDLDLLIKINNNAKCIVEITLTSFDESLCRIVEPNVSTTKERFEILKTMRDNGIQTIVWLSPILPFINDTEENIRGILHYCIEAKVYGILCFEMGLTLREGDREYFYEKLDVHFPGLKQKYQSKYGNNYILKSDRNKTLMEIFNKTCHDNNIVCDNDELFRYMSAFEENEKRQLYLFE